MVKTSTAGMRVATVAWLALFAAGVGCQSCRPDQQQVPGAMPRELMKVSLPTYTIEPPDILEIDAVRVVPLPPYRAEPLDLLLIQATGVLQDAPIAGLYPVTTEGNVDLGLAYGSVRVVGLTLEEIKVAIEKQLKLKKVAAPVVAVALGQSHGLQQIRGEHLVRPDGTVGLGTYGSVPVAGMTLQEAKAAVESLLSQHLQKPEVSIDVLAYNSKVIYVIFDGGGNGQQVVRLPATGNETVLDAVAQVGGLTPVSSTSRIWIARPGPAGAECDTVLPVDWCAITTRGRTESNYQLLPGDRLYVQAQHLVSIDNFLAKLFSPMERVFGFTLLGNGVVHSVAQPLNSNNGSNSGSTFP